MPNQKRGTSISVKFASVVLILFVLVVMGLLLVFIPNLRSITYRQTETIVGERISLLRDSIINTLVEQEKLLFNTSFGISALFGQGPVAQPDMLSYFSSISTMAADMEMLYFSNNNIWYLPNGYWASFPDWTPPAGWDNTVRPWFTGAKNAPGKVVYSEPFQDAYTGETIISLSTLVFDKNRNDIGVVAADVLVTKLNTLLNNSLIIPGQELFLLNKDGLFITHHDMEAVMAKNFFTETALGRLRNQILSLDMFSSMDKYTFIYSAKIPAAGWTLVSTIPVSEIYSENNSFIMRIVFFSFAILVVVVVIATVFTYRMFTIPLRALIQFADDIADLNFDMDFIALRTDEIGKIWQTMGKIRNNLVSTFNSIGQNTSLVSTAVYDLSASAKEITTTANEQSASVAEIVSTMESSKNLSAQVASKTVEVADLAAKTRELSRHGADLRDDNENMMADIRNKNAKIVEEIRNLTEILSRIDESVQLIDAIADQTKLIAFNAALEASSSGEAGSRFAVVAGEIRRFADNVVESVLEIKEKITELQNASGTLISEANNGSRAIDSGYNKMVEQKEVFENIVDVSQNVAIRSQQISNLSKQQELASEQIFTALKEISAGVKQFVTATVSTSATADKLNSVSMELKETLAKYQTESRRNV
jgi:methyl-accepting chemotaxis protein